MSLTSELDKPTSPITQYLRFVGTLVADAGRGAPWADACKRLLGLDNLAVSTTVAAVAGANPSMVGAAFDYRLRYHLAPCQGQNFVAWHGAVLLGKLNASAQPHLARFFSNLDELAEHCSPAGCQLCDDEERLLDTYCVVLAQLESIYLTGGGWVPQLPASKAASVRPQDEPLLALAPISAVEDVMNLSRSADVVFGDLIGPVVSGALTYHANPVFAGSRAIGGADADFIIEGTIFELKTTKSFGAPAIRKALLQLLRYCLLDYDDQHDIRQVGLYFSRQGWVTAWPLWQRGVPQVGRTPIYAASWSCKDSSYSRGDM
jgi:hypothetical protein